MAADPDDTVRIRRALPPDPHNRLAAPTNKRSISRGLLLPVAGCLILLLGVGAGLGIKALRSPLTRIASTPSTRALATASPAIPPIRLANEAEIDANRSDGVTVFRFAPNPHVLVLDFASLALQGEMMNRLAALIEKKGQPRDRVLDDQDLSKAIHDSGDTPETYYYGHDYRADDVARFFALADRDHVRLTPAEEELRTLARREGWFRPDAVGAVISIPRAGSGPIDEAARGTILHHELSHGEYFTNPAYVAYVTHFWDDVLTADERERFMRFLTEEGYDPADQDLIRNEMQAYLMHTRDPRFFNPDVLGLTQEAVEQMRAAFRNGMPRGWLRDATPQPDIHKHLVPEQVPVGNPVSGGSHQGLPHGAILTPAQAGQPRQRRQRRAVSTTKACAARRPLRARKPSIAA
jgi:hypothetical protein